MEYPAAPDGDVEMVAAAPSAPLLATECAAPPLLLHEGWLSAHVALAPALSPQGHMRLLQLLLGAEQHSSRLHADSDEQPPRSSESLPRALASAVHSGVQCDSCKESPVGAAL